VALRAVADDGDFFAFDQRKIGVFIVIDFHGFLYDKRETPDAG
jgi:hypothetical protein